MSEDRWPSRIGSLTCPRCTDGPRPVWEQARSLLPFARGTRWGSMEHPTMCDGVGQAYYVLWAACERCGTVLYPRADDPLRAAIPPSALRIA